jgi:NAD(P)-dependent dehydrogenase (short-subunit alcohol dehydrogenase family)
MCRSPRRIIVVALSREGPTAKRVEGKAAIVVGGGQTPGQTIGNGRAVAVVLAREGARVLVVDRLKASAQDTVDMIHAEGGEAWAHEADTTDEDAVRRLVAAAHERFGRLDILHNNVGASLALGDATATELTVEAFDRSVAVNLKGMWLACKHALPALRESSGSIVNISSMAARNAYPLVGYKTTKAAVVALTENLAAANAQYGVRANAILPGLMNTPMAIEARVAKGTPRDEVIASRDRRVPLRRRMGTGWDVAYAALYLHSDEAGFVTGVSLAVDGGEGVSWGS